MTSVNVELARSIWAAWERGDFGSAECAAPDIEFAFVGGPSPGTWTGLTAMAEAMHEFLDPWTEYRAEAEEIRELGGDRVLTISHARAGRGKASGFDLDQITMRGANLFEIRAGKVVRLVNYWDRDDAFAELGLTHELSES